MSYSDILSGGGMDPRSKIEDSMYRLTVAQRDAAWREVEAWKQRYAALSSCITNTALMHTNPPVTLMAEPQSFNAGKELAERQMLQLFTDPENQPTQHGTVTVEYMQREIAAERERICKAIKEEDDYCVTEGDYMLDSDDCIAVARGVWVRPDYSVDATQAKGRA